MYCKSNIRTTWCAQLPIPLFFILTLVSQLPWCSEAFLGATIACRWDLHQQNLFSQKYSYIDAWCRSRSLYVSDGAFSVPEIVLNRHLTSDNGHGNEKGNEYPQDQERGFGPRAYRDDGSLPANSENYHCNPIGASREYPIRRTSLGPLEDEVTMKIMVQAQKTLLQECAPCAMAGAGSLPSSWIWATSRVHVSASVQVR